MTFQMPTPDNDELNGTNGNGKHHPDENLEDDPAIAAKTHTASKMLSLFRQMEENQHQSPSEAGPKPLKRFTPPPDQGRRIFNRDSGSEPEYSDEEEVGCTTFVVIID